MVADWLVDDRELEHPVEQQAAASRAATVEAEDELVEVARQMGVLDGALVGAEEPPLGQLGDAVHGR